MSTEEEARRMTLLNIAQSGGGMGRYLEEAKRFPC